MNYIKEKKDNYSIFYIIVLCFILFGLFVIVPLVLVLYSRNLRFFYLYEGLSTSNWILVGYCVVVIAVACYLLYRINKEQQKGSSKDLEDRITEKVGELTLTKDEIASLINTKLQDRSYHVTIEAMPNTLKSASTSASKSGADEGEG